MQRGSSRHQCSTRDVLRDAANYSERRSASCVVPAASSAIILAAFVVALSSERTSQQTRRTQLDAVVASLIKPSALRDDGATSTDCTEVGGDDEATTTLLNWSGTHAVQVSNDRYWEPESVEEVERIVRQCHLRGQPVRPLGSALSPNGIAFQSDGMVSMVNLDRVLDVQPADPQSGRPATVTVQAGARVSQVVDALRPHNLTLPNLASIAEQQMGGFVQVGAHGTGRCIAPVDHYVTRIKMVTPAKGTVTLTKEDGEMFELAKVGLGCLGIVVEVTMECVPAHKLVEHTFVLTRQQADERLDELLQKHRHMRYMWIPYADAVVVVTNDPEDAFPNKKVPMSPSFSKEERFQPLTNLLAELTKDAPEPIAKDTIMAMGFGELRDALLAAVDPLDIEHVKRCNQAEAEFWQRSEGYQVKPSDELLQFDCGGQVRSVRQGYFIYIFQYCTIL